MGENCQKPGRSVTKTGNSSTPETQMKPCNGCGLGVFQGRLFKTGLPAVAAVRQARMTMSSHASQVRKACRTETCLSLAAGRRIRMNGNCDSA
ncbi:hypothetical protein BVV20_13950 [Xanthomonas oryzae pv. oryzae]|nr:hypothetical protein BVV20_13950 [Xanthomonas oryzae pv. oryzae]